MFPSQNQTGNNYKPQQQMTGWLRFSNNTNGNLSGVHHFGFRCLCFEIQSHNSSFETISLLMNFNMFNWQSWNQISSYRK